MPKLLSDTETPLDSTGPDALAVNQVVARNDLLLQMAQTNCIAAPGSPLANFIGPDARLPAVAQEVKAGSDLLSALKVLANPKEQIQIRTALPNGVFLSSYYAAGRVGPFPMYGCWIEGDSLRISGPWSNLDLADQLGRDLSPAHAAPPGGSLYRLTRNGLATLATVQDLLRTFLFQSMLSGQPLSDLMLSIETVTHFRNERQTKSDQRWFSPALLSLWPDLFSDNGIDIQKGLDELVEAELLVSRPEENAWQPTASLGHLTVDLQSSLPAISIERNRLHEPDVFSTQLVLFRGRSLWEVGYDPTQTGSADSLFFRDVAPLVAFDDVVTFLGGIPQVESLPPRRPPPQGPSVSEQPSQCEVQLVSLSADEKEIPFENLKEGFDLLGDAMFSPHRPQPDVTVSSADAEEDVEIIPPLSKVRHRALDWLTAFAALWGIGCTIIAGIAFVHADFVFALFYFLTALTYALIVWLARRASQQSGRKVAMWAGGLSFLPIATPLAPITAIVGVVGLLVIFTSFYD